MIESDADFAARQVEAEAGQRFADAGRCEHEPVWGDSPADWTSAVPEGECACGQC